MELIPVNIIIGDRNYRIKILPRDEEAVRKSVKLINDKIIEFKTQFAGKDMQDYIAMVLIWFATQQTQQTHQMIADEQVGESLKGLEKIIDKILT